MKTVLVVEDDLINWRVFQKILTKQGGWAARHTENVEEVMHIAKEKEADIILMDVSLRNSYYQGEAIDGIAITQMLKAHPHTSQVPVILVTANGSICDREEFLLASGADGYIPKPVTNHRDFVAQIKAKISSN